MLIHDDCLNAMKALPENSVDSLVTDPPAGISFMGKEWDKGNNFIPCMSEIFKETLRVLKPGAHGLVWALPRTSHWTATALENAGFEIRDSVVHIFGSGFPKNLNIYKQLQKSGQVCQCHLDEETQYQMHDVRDADIQETVSVESDEKSLLQHKMSQQILSEQGKQNEILRGDESLLEGRKIHRAGQSSRESETLFDSQRTLDRTSQDGRYCSECKKIKREAVEGLGSSLKPAHEIWWLIRKPCSEKTVAANVLKYGTGGINIDACRIGLKDGDKKSEGGQINVNSTTGIWGNVTSVRQDQTQGRFPANLVLDEEAAEMLDEQSGITKSIGGEKSIKQNAGVAEMNASVTGANPYFNYGDIGGASRFFYVAKASKKDRNEGCEELPLVKMQNFAEGTKRKLVAQADDEKHPNLPRQNHHPCVKPTKLMEYLITLITPPSGTVLDPFMGSGSTGKAAKRLGFNFIGIEKEQEYFKIAEKRISA